MDEPTEAPWSPKGPTHSLHCDGPPLRQAFTVARACSRRAYLPVPRRPPPPPRTGRGFHGSCAVLHRMRWRSGSTVIPKIPPVRFPAVLSVLVPLADLCRRAAGTACRYTSLTQAGDHRVACSAQVSSQYAVGNFRGCGPAGTGPCSPHPRNRPLHRLTAKAVDSARRASGRCGLVDLLPLGLGCTTRLPDRGPPAVRPGRTREGSEDGQGPYVSVVAGPAGQRGPFQVMRRRRRSHEDVHRPSTEEILEALDLLPGPGEEERIALAIDANRCALRGGAARTSAADLRAMLEQMESAGTVRRFAPDSLDRPQSGPRWWSAARARQQAEERRTAAERASDVGTKPTSARGRHEAEIAEISEALQEERARGGSPLKRAVDATLEANERTYQEYRRRSGGEGGAN